MLLMLSKKMSDKLPTQQELLAEHRLVLDAKFREKFPDGRFCIQDFHGWRIHWEFRRPTSHDRFRGVSVEIEHNRPVKKDFRASSFGKCSNHNSLEKLLAACEKRNVPTELIDMFLEHYQSDNEKIKGRYK